jgi:uncharacterized protein YwqG
MAEVFVESGECDIYSSKLGGEYYGEKVEGLQFLGQINWAAVPEIENYPKTGLLQFFIGDLNSRDYKFKVRYFKNFEMTDTRKFRTEKVKQTDDFYSPLNYKEMPLSFEKHIELNRDFDKYFSKITKEVLGKSYSVYDFENTPSLYGKLSEYYWGSSCKIGGNPKFTQEDPRKLKGKEDTKHTELLFECVSTDGFCNKFGNDKPICWGDWGIGNFFISKNDLKELNFDDVLYVWDCS